MFAIILVYGLIALAILGLYLAAIKLKGTIFSWPLAFILGFGVAIALEFCFQIAFMMAFGVIPLQPCRAGSWASKSSTHRAGPAILPC